MTNIKAEYKRHTNYRQRKTFRSAKYSVINLHLLDKVYQLSFKMELQKQKQVITLIYDSYLLDSALV